jgi:hypothetical protein
VAFSSFCGPCFSVGNTGPRRRPNPRGANPGLAATRPRSAHGAAICRSECSQDQNLMSAAAVRPSRNVAVMQLPASILHESEARRPVARANHFLIGQHRLKLRPLGHNSVFQRTGPRSNGWTFAKQRSQALPRANMPARWDAIWRRLAFCSCGTRSGCDLDPQSRFD